jgi:hypothetical protein
LTGKTYRVTVTLDAEKHLLLTKYSKKKGLPLPTICRLLLSEDADRLAEDAAK